MVLDRDDSRRAEELHITEVLLRLISTYPKALLLKLALLDLAERDLRGLACVLFADPLWSRRASGDDEVLISPCFPECMFCQKWIKARASVDLATVRGPQIPLTLKLPNLALCKGVFW